MNCSACHHDNQSARVLRVRCAPERTVRRAGTHAPRRVLPRMRWSLAAARAPPTTQSRKVVTIVPADLIGSAALERLDPESVTASWTATTAVASQSAHGGTVVQPSATS